MVLTLMSRSPWGPGFLAPIATRIVSAQLSASVGAPGPHDFAVRLGVVRPREKIARAAKASIASRAAFRDDRDTPLVTARDARTYTSVFQNTQGEIFLLRRLDSIFARPPRRANQLREKRVVDSYWSSRQAAWQHLTYHRYWHPSGAALTI
jgi:hypothetical protein